MTAISPAGPGVQSRVIPALLLDGDRFVKTIRFEDPKYVGDPVNVLSIFNNFEVDELVLLDIGAAARRYPIQFELLQRLTSEAFVPLAYGGGVQTLADAEELVRIGFEKVIINTALVEHPDEVRRMVDALGASGFSAEMESDQSAVLIHLSLTYPDAGAGSSTYFSCSYKLIGVKPPS